MPEAMFERWAGDFNGCGDNSCVLKRPKGMGTNGGCRCRESKLRVVMQRMKRSIAELEAKNKYQDEVIEQRNVECSRQFKRIAELEEIIAKWYEYWPEPWAEGLDGFEMQEFGVKHGILERLERTVPCEENCNCAEYYGHGETAICYRLKPEFLKALKEEG